MVDEPAVKTILQKREDAFRKIRGLLNKAESTNFEEEANAFLAKAQELMINYQIDEAEVWENDPTKKPVPVIRMVKVNTKNVGAQWVRILFNVVAKHNNCVGWQQDAQGQHIAGYESDIMYVELLFNTLYNHLRFELVKGLAISTENARTFRNNFIQAYVQRVHIRLNEADRMAKHKIAQQSHMYLEGNPGSMELVLRSRKEDVDEFVRREIGRFTSVNVRSGQRSEGARRLGDLAGSKADITAGRRGMEHTKPKGELNK